MKEWQSLAHVRWECKYHVVFVPKYRKKVMFGRRRKQVGKILHQLCRQKGVEMVEGHAMPDHVHLVLSIPPKFSGDGGGLPEREIRDTGSPPDAGCEERIHREALWSRGYCVSTVGLDEQTVRAYVRNQEELDRQESLEFDE